MVSFFWLLFSGIEADGIGWVAHMTLVLPPTHPSLTKHPLFMTIPKNTCSKEYINVVDLIGGVKRWSGSSKQFKVSFSTLAIAEADI
jgi:hypothetical protein